MTPLPTRRPTRSSTDQLTYLVAGMTCSHCQMAVIEAQSAPASAARAAEPRR
jgi:hypothetical protein